MGANLRTTSRYLTRQVSALTETSEESGGTNFGGTGYYTTHWTQNEAVWGNIWCHTSPFGRSKPTGNQLWWQQQQQGEGGGDCQRELRAAAEFASNPAASEPAAVLLYNQSSSSVFRTSH